MCLRSVALTVLALALAAGTAHAGEFNFDFHGSLGPEKHTRYVPPLVNPLFNETSYITTEARPAYLHYEIPEGFLTTGGTIDVYALELRLALTERLGIIASKDGYADADFDARPARRGRLRKRLDRIEVRAAFGSHAAEHFFGGYRIRTPARRFGDRGHPLAGQG
jgi:hypothetical protein